ncbi:MAG TPA: hypothetical protein VFZ91_00185 [Allosphingosinicella sp.]
MKIVERQGDRIVMEVGRTDLARLSKLLGWIEDSRSGMDEGMILMDEDDIDPTVRRWIEFIQCAIADA